MYSSRNLNSESKQEFNQYNRHRNPPKDERSGSASLTLRAAVGSRNVATPEQEIRSAIIAIKEDFDEG